MNRLLRRENTLSAAHEDLLVPHFSAVPASDPVSDAQSEALTRGAIVIPPEVMAEIYGELARYDGGEDAEEEGGIHGVREEEEEGELGDDEASGTGFDTVDTLSPELLQLRAARVSSATAATKSYHAALQVYYYILQDDTPHPTP